MLQAVILNSYFALQQCIQILALYLTSKLIIAPKLKKNPTLYHYSTILQEQKEKARIIFMPQLHCQIGDSGHLPHLLSPHLFCRDLKIKQLILSPDSLTCRQKCELGLKTNSSW